MRRAFLAVVATIVFGAACSQDPDEIAIRSLIEGMRSSMETKSFERVVASVSEDYRDNLGQNREELLGRLQRFFHGYDSLHVSAAIEEIERSALSASAELKLKINGQRDGKSERIYGSALSAKPVWLYLEKRGGAWLVVGSSVNIRRGLF